LPGLGLGRACGRDRTRREVSAPLNLHVVRRSLRPVVCTSAGAATTRAGSRPRRPTTNARRYELSTSLTSRERSRAPLISSCGKRDDTPAAPTRVDVATRKLSCERYGNRIARCYARGPSNSITETFPVRERFFLRLRHYAPARLSANVYPIRRRLEYQNERPRTTPTRHWITTHTCARQKNDRIRVNENGREFW